MNFKTMKRETKYNGRVFDIEKVHMQLPTGEVRAYDLVNHPSAVTIVPLDAAGNILFVCQYRVGAEEELLELPAGLFNDGEDPDPAAARELREETGMAAENLTRIGAFYSSPGYSSEYLYIYLATGLYPAPLKQDDDEFIQLESIPAAKALEMARGGEIRDAKTPGPCFWRRNDWLFEPNARSNQRNRALKST